MQELNAKELGNEVKRLRKLQHLSQQQLAAGICTQPTISGIEAGKVYPSIDILYLISIRLKVSLDYLFNILLNEANHYITETQEHIEDLLKKKNYQEVYEICQYEMDQKIAYNLNHHFKLYIKWANIISGYYLKEIDWDQCVEDLKIVLNQLDILSSHDFLDLKIINSMAIIYAENKRYEQSLDEYNKILHQKEFLLQQPKFHLKVQYNLSKLNFSIGKYEQSLSHATVGIRLSKRLEDISVLGQLFFQQGECYERLGRTMTDIKKCYQNSLSIFELLDLDILIHLVREQKGKYL